MTEFYTMHYRTLVRLAAMLVRDIATAEELVQESFVAMHAAWPRLADGDGALSYLRQSVVKRSRSVQGRRAADEHALDPPGAGQGAMIQPDGSALLSAVRALPARQREVLVLRFYVELSEAQIASVLGTSAAAVRSRIASAMLSLRGELAGPIQ